MMLPYLCVIKSSQVQLRYSLRSVAAWAILRLVCFALDDAYCRRLCKFVAFGVGRFTFRWNLLYLLHENCASPIDGRSAKFTPFKELTLIKTHSSRGNTQTSHALFSMLPSLVVCLYDSIVACIFSAMFCDFLFICFSFRLFVLGTALLRGVGKRTEAGFPCETNCQQRTLLLVICVTFCVITFVPKVVFSFYNNF